MTGRRFSALRRFPAIHLLRVALFVAVIALIHAQHRKLTSRRQALSLSNIAIETLRAYFPKAARHGDATPEGGLVVLSEAGTVLGQVVQTAPDSDRYVGFSGPTNVLVALSPDREVIGAEILRSGDTRDHVQLVARDSRFWRQLEGRSVQQLAGNAPVDGVAGATLTTVAIRQGLQARFGGTAVAAKFPDPPDLPDVRRLFPEATAIVPEVGTPQWTVRAGDKSLGTLLRTSPAADQVVGYQGPTDALVGLDPAGKIVGVVLGVSFDNEEYVAYVRGDDYFREFWNGRSLTDLARSDPLREGFEGVSGATMTSVSVARGLVLAARNAQQTSPPRPSAWQVPWRTLGTVAIVGWGLVVALTGLRGKSLPRFLLQGAVVGYLGFMNGELLSQAMFVGWAQSGIPVRGAVGLVVLSAAALVVPLLTRRNVYCSHLCPHGAVQQWLRPSVKRTWHPPPGMARMLKLVRPALLIWIVFVAMFHWPFSLVDIEPFDAYVWQAAGWATVTIAIAGLVASAFVPMAYCRYGCPTGAVLDFVRTHGTATHWTTRDWFATALTVTAGGIYLWS